jgi:hypothetical protein
MTIEEAIAYWHRRYETEPEPLKSFAREHIKQLLLIQDSQGGQDERLSAPSSK